MQPVFPLPALGDAGPVAATVPWTAAAGIAAEIATPAAYAGMAADWDALAPRAAEANVFMDPAVAAAAAALGARAPVLVARDGARLVGAWALRIGRPRSGLPWPILVTPADRSAFSSTPVLDRDRAEAAMAAMLDAIAAAPGLPKIVGIEMMNDDGPVMAALAAALRRRGSPPARFLRRDTRPVLRSTLGAEAYAAAALSGDRRRRLRALRRRLGESGALSVTCHRAPAAVAAALPRFRALEGAGWKGRVGTAIARTPDIDAFFATAIGGLAARGCVELWELARDGEAIAMAVLLRSAGSLFGWKMAYDERFRDFAPGILLGQDMTAHYLADPATVALDSSSYDASGPFARLWRERQATANLLIDVRPGRSPALAMIAGSERLYRAGRQAAKAPFHRLRDALGRRGRDASAGHKAAR